MDSPNEKEQKSKIEPLEKNETPCCLNIDNFQTVYDTCKPIYTKWRRLAVLLYIDKRTVEVIRKDGKDADEKYKMVLDAWLRKDPGSSASPSWRLLSEAVSHVDKELSEKIATEYNCRRVPKNTLISRVIQQEGVKAAAEKLKKDFDDLIEFLYKEVNVDGIEDIRHEIIQYFGWEEKKDELIEMHLSRIEDYSNAKEVLNYFFRHEFIGYINYSLIKIFQKVAKTKELAAKRIEKYEEDYHCFLEQSLVAIHDAFQQCPDLLPNYPAGLPMFTVHLKSEWDGSSALELREFLKHRLDYDCVDNLLVVKIIRDCVIITYCVLPHVADRIVKYLTDYYVIDSLNMVGVTIDISPQLQLCSQDLMYNEDEPLLPSVRPEGDDDTPDDDDDGRRMVELQDDVSLKEAINTYEYHLKLLRSRNKALESSIQMETKMKQNVMKELDTTKKSLEKLKTAEQSKTQKISSRLKWAESVITNKDKVISTLKQDTNKLRLSIQQKKGVSDEEQKEMDRALLKAAREGDHSTVQRLVQSGADIETRDGNQSTPIHLASQEGHTEIVNVLLSHGASVDIQDKNGQSPVILALLRAHKEIAQLLLSHGADLNHEDKWGQSAILVGTVLGHEELLLSNKVNSDVISKYRLPAEWGAKVLYGEHIEYINTKTRIKQEKHPNLSTT